MPLNKHHSIFLQGEQGLPGAPGPDGPPGPMVSGSRPPFSPQIKRFFKFQSAAKIHFELSSPPSRVPLVYLAWRETPASKERR